MKKDIYVIRNTINNKCYIGQSVDYRLRFRKHCEEARRNNYTYKSYLYNAMNELGIDNFYVELLESQVEDYNEKEIYYINKFNSLRPNGYNLASGGEWYPNLSGTEHHNARITSEDVLMSIIDELKNSSYSLTEIGEHHGVSYSVIYDINNGITYIQNEVSYPIREFTLSKEKFDRLVFDLKYSAIPYSELGFLYNLSTNQVKAINAGRSWHKEYIQYPIRQVVFRGADDKYSNIQRDLLSTNKTFEELAKKYGCSESTIRRINLGETAKNNNLKYPLRRVGMLSSMDIYEIHKLLLADKMSINEIARKYRVSAPTIKRINSGKTKKYIDERFTYPLRK